MNSIRVSVSLISSALAHFSKKRTKKQKKNTGINIVEGTMRGQRLLIDSNNFSRYVNRSNLHYHGCLDRLEKDRIHI